jgi:hypothetical protein
LKIVLSCSRKWCLSSYIHLALLNIHISNSNGSFTLYVDVSFLYHCQDFDRTWLCVRVRRRVSYKKQERLTLRDHPRFFCAMRVAHYLFCLCCPIVCLYVMSSVLWCPLCDFRKNDVRFVFTSFFVGERMSYLR